MDNFYILLLFAIPVLVLISIYASTMWKIFITWRTPLTWISAMPGTGWVEVTGHVRGEAKDSLLDKTPCIYWQVEAQEWRNSGRGGGYWRTTLVKSSGSFEVDDGTGRVRIDEGKPNLIISQENCIQNPAGADRTTLEELGVKFTGLLGLGKKIRVFERKLCLDDEVLVVGKAAPKQGMNVLAGASIIPHLVSSFDRRQTISALFMRRTRTMAIALVILVAWIGMLVYIFSQAK